MDARGHPALANGNLDDYPDRQVLSLGLAENRDFIVQECGIGLVGVRVYEDQLAFRAPPLTRSGPVSAEELATVLDALDLSQNAILGAEWVVNGPEWLALRMKSRASLLAVRPRWDALSGYKVGLVAPWDRLQDGDEAQFEVRAFTGGTGGYEDPVTGSLNAGIAQWLIGAGIAPEKYVVSQGTALGRARRVHVALEDGEILIGGDVVTRISGTITV